MLVHTNKFAAILLAAGQSTRFETGSKLTHIIKDRPLISWSLSPLIKSNLEQVIIVTGCHAETINTAITPLKDQHPNLTTIHNEIFELGMGNSIATGMTAISSNIEGVFICLADMPKITEDIFTKLAHSFANQQNRETTKNKSIFRPSYQGKPGHPVLFSKIHFEKLASLNGNQGARQIIKSNQDALELIAMDSPHTRLDIDNRQDLTKLFSY